MRLQLPAELRVLAAALVVAVAASSAVGFFTARIEAAIERQAGEVIGADRRLQDRAVPPAQLEQLAADAGVQIARTAAFPSVALAGDNSTLASIKAVDPAYPLRGAVRIADQPFGADRETRGGPPADAVWIDARLAAQLDVSAGDVIQLGRSNLTVDAFITFEPDRGRGFTTLAPRLMMRRADLPATELIVPGSRVRYSVLVAGADPALDAFERAAATVLKPAQQWTTAATAQSQLGDAIDRARRFMRLAALTAVLLAAVAMGMAAVQYAANQQDAVALKKTLGATGRRILYDELRRLAWLALGAGLLGAIIGYIAQFGLVAAIGPALELELPAAPLSPAVPALLTGFAALIGFAAPPLAQLRHVPPMRVFQRQLGAPPVSIWVAASCAAVVLIGLLIWQTRDALLASLVLAGTAGGLALMAALGWALTWALAPLRRQIGGGWRYGLANLSRRRGQTVLQLVSVGLGLTVLLLLGIVRADLLQTWKNELPSDAPNAFLVNVQPDQVDGVRTFLADNNLGDPTLYPMLLGRLVQVNGAAVTAEDYDDPDAKRLLEREFNISWVEALTDDNRITDGQWWGEAGRGQPLASIEQIMVEWFGFEIGDTLTFDIAGERRTLTIHNFREVEWDSFGVNFFLVTPPGVFEDAPATWLTSLHVPQAAKPALIELVRAYPNITVFDVDVLLAQVRRVVDRVTLAVEAVFAFTLIAGLLVLLAALQSTRQARLREAALLRTLGASRARLRAALLAEFGALGALAGLLAAGCAQGIANVLAAVAFQIAYAPNPTLWIAGPIAGAAVAALAAWIGARGAVRRAPLATLR